MKLWDKKKGQVNKKIDKFTIGKDQTLDLELMQFDIKGTIAHAKLLVKLNILSQSEFNQIKKVLLENIVISEDDEDCHSAIEKHLTKKLGDTGKKIHTGRSRNDQVLTAIRLYEKSQINEVIGLIKKFQKSLTKIAKQNKKQPMVGYTHMQKAMPTTVHNWLTVFEESMQDNIFMLKSVLKLIDKNPLGSAAGYGTGLIKDLNTTTKELGFSSSMANPNLAQHTRGKYELQILGVLSGIMYDLNKLATDLLLYSTAEFNYVILPKEICTGSSIMPQKNNGDVLELIRANYHIINGEQHKVQGLIGNLISGYNRDLQLTKEPIINGFNITKDCLEMMIITIKGIKFNYHKINKSLSKEIYATEEAYKLVKKGIPFREAYKIIGKKF